MCAFRFSKKVFLNLICYSLFWFVKSLFLESGFKKYKLGDLSLKLLPNDLGLSRELMLFGIHEPVFNFYLKHLVKEDSVVIDVGSNLGYNMLLFAKYAPRGKVICLEPNPVLFKLLKYNIGANNFTHVIPLLCAAGNKSGFGLFCVDPFYPQLAHLNTGSKSDGIVYKVKIISIDDLAQLLRLDKVDLIKLDVEGFEWEILEGALNTIRAHKPNIAVEIHLIDDNSVKKMISFLEWLRSHYEFCVLILRIYDCWPARVEDISVIMKSEELIKILSNDETFRLIGNVFSLILLRDTEVYNLLKVPQSHAGNRMKLFRLLNLNRI
jgi:FkbM family methyltransferase